jgi:hypothetical protein
MITSSTYVTKLSGSKAVEAHTSKGVRFLNLLPACLEELFEIEHPWIKPSDTEFTATKNEWLNGLQSSRPELCTGCYFYYPHDNLIIQLPPEPEFKLLRTSRNRNLVTAEEQVALFTKTIAVAGMSVGSNIVKSLVHSGVGGAYRLADMDTISVPNLNRLLAPLKEVDQPKVDYIARYITEVDPFTELGVLRNGLQLEDFSTFLEGVDVFVEEVDNPFIKVKSREYCKKKRIPLVMTTDNGDGVFIDVERYDAATQPEPFNGRLRSFNLNEVGPKMSFSEKLSMASEMAGLREATSRMQTSISQVGSILNTWPQLGTAAILGGAATTFVLKHLLLGTHLPSGRYYVDQDSLLLPHHASSRAKSERAKHTDATMKGFRNFQNFLKKTQDL